jgi:hypothetical protein
LNPLHILGINVHGHESAFMEIDREPRGLGKLIQQQLEADNSWLTGAHDNERVIGILQNGTWGTSSQGVAQDQILSDH